jgi:hypothetical protein
MTTIALVGGASTTRGAVQFSKADEIWTANWSYKYDYVPRIDRLFEMHPVWLYAETDKVAWSKPKEHWEWLQLEHPYPIYCLQKHPDVPAAVRYPIEDVVDEIFGGLLIKRNWEEATEEEQRFSTSSFDYMFGLAILMKEEWSIDTIEIFGVEMGADTEYRYQKYGASFFIQAAMARGIKVVVPHNSVIMKSKLYGYEGAQMIFRTDLENYLAKYNTAREEGTAALNHLEGQGVHMAEELQRCVNEYGIEDDRSKLAAMIMSEHQQKMQDQRDITSIAAGAYQAVFHLIKEVDLEVSEGELMNIWGRVKPI